MGTRPDSGVAVLLAGVPEAAPGPAEAEIPGACGDGGSQSSIAKTGIRG